MPLLLHRVMPAVVNQRWNIVRVALKGLCMGHRGCAGQVYIISASDQPCELVDQYCFSFGLKDRDKILVVTGSYIAL